MAKAFYSDPVKHYMRRWLLQVDSDGNELTQTEQHRALAAHTPAGRPMRLQALPREIFAACTNAFKELEPDRRAWIAYIYSAKDGMVPAVRQVATDESISTAKVWAAVARFERRVAKLANLI